MSEPLLPCPDAVLRELFSRARNEHPSLALGFRVFADRVWALHRHRVRAQGLDQAADLLERLFVSDLFLAIACDHQAPGAWETLLHGVLPRLKRRLAGGPLSSVHVDDLVGELPGDLLARPGHSGSVSRLGTYDGTGPLLRWLEVVCRRNATARFRKDTQRTGPESSPRVPGAEAQPSGDTVLEQEQARRMAAVVARVWGGFSPKGMLVMHYKYAEGLSQRTIAHSLAMSESRVSRLLSQCVEELRGTLRRELPESLEDSTGKDRILQLLRDALPARLPDLSSEVKQRPSTEP